MMKIRAVSVFAAGITMVAAAHATNYDDTLSGADLSCCGDSPTVLPVTLGGNKLVGVVDFVGDGLDIDFFTFTVPTGAALTRIDVLPGTTLGATSTFQVGAGIVMPATLIGSTNFAPTDIGTDILPRLAGGPLAAGAYTFKIQETAVGTSPYAFNFEIASVMPAVPEASTAATLLAGLALLAGLRRRRA